jgi:Phosphoribosylaminoimidazole (AIR) synthetase
VRELIKLKKISLNGKFGTSSLGKTLLKPTKLYVNEILKLSE